MLDPEGGLYPVVEINARHNMSTYQVGLEERFVGEGRIAVARHYPLRLTTPLSFAETRTLLDGLLFDPARGSGLLVNNHATVNAGFAETAETAGHTVDGRLYGVLVAESDDRVGALDTEIAARLAARKDNAA